MTIAPLGREATLEDLWNFDGPAELINGEIVPLTGTQLGPGEAAFLIRLSLYQHARANGGGRAVSESVTFVLETPRTQALVPDVSWFVGEAERDEVIHGAPALAVEIRSKGGGSAPASTSRFRSGVRPRWTISGSRISRRRSSTTS
jgi:Uma2 family endonuclease